MRLRIQALRSPHILALAALIAVATATPTASLSANLETFELEKIPPGDRSFSGPAKLRSGNFGVSFELPELSQARVPKRHIRGRHRGSQDLENLGEVFLSVGKSTLDGVINIIAVGGSEAELVSMMSTSFDVEGLAKTASLLPVGKPAKNGDRISGKYSPSGRWLTWSESPLGEWPLSKGKWEAVATTVVGPHGVSALVVTVSSKEHLAELQKVSEPIIASFEFDVPQRPIPTPAISTPAATATTKAAPPALPKMTPVPSWVPRAVELPKGAVPKKWTSLSPGRVRDGEEKFTYSIDARHEDVVAFHKFHLGATAGWTVKSNDYAYSEVVSGYSASIYPYVFFEIQREFGNEASVNVTVTMVHHDEFLSPPGAPAPKAPPNLPAPLPPGATIGRVVPGEGRMFVSCSTPRPFDEVVAFLERHPMFASADKSGPTTHEEDLHTPAPYTSRIVGYDSTSAVVGTPPLLVEVRSRRDFVYVTMGWGIVAADGVERYKCSLGSIGSRVVALRGDGTVTVESGSRGTFTTKRSVGKNLDLSASLYGEAWNVSKGRFGLNGTRWVDGKRDGDIRCEWVDQSVPLPVPAATLTQADRLRSECDAGTAKSCTSLGYLYEDGTGGATQSDSRAADLFERACNLRDGRGCNALGLMTEDGLGGRGPNSAAAFRLYKKGCDLGHSKSCYNQGSAYEDGSGVSRNIDRAIDAYERACDLGDDEACDAFDDLTGN